MLTHSQASAPPQRVVLLGAGGFVARALHARLAASGIPVVPITREICDLAESSSVARLQAVLKPGDSLVVAAALTPDRGKDFATLTQNLRIAEHICAALLPGVAGHVVYLSSDAVYGDAASPINEATPPAPSDLYGMMHRIRELAFAEAAKRAGISLCVLRPCAIYGPGDTHNSYGPNRFWRTAISERKIRLFGDGADVRDHVFVGDVVELLERALLRRSSGELNICSGTAVTFKEVALQVQAALGGVAELVPSPRTNPVTRRFFDAGAIATAFPGFCPTSLSRGLTSLAERQ